VQSVVLHLSQGAVPKWVNYVDKTNGKPRPKGRGGGQSSIKFLLI